ncbi:TBC1 domain family member 10A-like [Tropilaelaps mercedesae]|uniref:TBC1 domain family member 10A-like n=1 Tax=Tropilaelaps mercedesae TaxID=418985 RepID=A0A1V9XS49_9ACAR|nr:TBC1 domain family member 10A-like [Tropilaelaps mercedesae]
MNVNGRGDEPESYGTQPQEQPDKYGFFGSQHVTTDVRNLESTLAPEVIRRREMKWRHMLANWDLFTSKKFSKVRDRCRKGIPSSMRMLAWQYLCGGKFRKDKCKGLFEQLDAQNGDPGHVDDIRKDLHRQFPQHEIFKKEKLGQQELFRLLKAYSILRPEVGYCQAQAPVASLLLMHMPTEDAFFCFVEICDKYLKGYYSPGLETIQLDGLILFGLLRKFSSQAHHQLTKLEVGPMLVMTEWFLCVFTRTLPWPCVLRVFDMFLCEGIRVLFKVGVVLIDSTLGSHSISKAELRKRYPSAFELLECLKHAGDNLEEDAFIQQVVDLELKREDLVREHERQIAKKEKEERDRQKKALKAKRR